MSEPPAEVRALAEERAEARQAKDFALADELRDRIADAGWKVVDAPGGWSLEPMAVAAKAAVAASDVTSVLDQPATADFSLLWVCEGWPEDIQRAIDGFRRNGGANTLQFVVADVTGQSHDAWGDDVEVVSLEPGTGWAAARNAGLRRSLGEVVVALDGSVEPTGDALGPLAEALRGDRLGVCGPFGVITRDLREFHAASGPGPCDAVEGYLMAFRRDLLSEVGGFDEKFRWYRTADIEWCFRVKDAGYSCGVADVPVIKHEHRMWFETPHEERAKWSKRNFYRFLDRWRDRWDLVLSGEPQSEEPSPDE